MRTVALAAAVVLIALPTFAQPSCPTPVVVQTGGPNPTCAGVPVTLDAGANWVSYHWSNGATQRFLIDSPAVTTSYWVTATDANGCSATSQPFQVSVVPAPPPPALSLSSAALCPGASGTVTDTSGATWTSHAWSITHGTITADHVTSADFTIDGSGPAVVSYVVTDANGCTVTGSATVNVRTIGAPLIRPGAAQICAGSFGSAYLDPPADRNSSWQNVVWTVTNATVNYQSSTSISFNTDPSGQPVTVRVDVTDNQGCSSTSSVTIPVRTIAPAALHAGEASICPGSYGYAFVDPPDDHNTSWQTIQWTVTNGTINYQSTTSVSFTTDPSGQPATVTAVATDSLGCSKQSSITIPVRSIPPPALHPGEASICPGSYGYAFIDPPADHNTSWQTIQWTVTNGTINYQSTTSVSFTTDPTGRPATVTAVATDSLGCSNSASITIPVRAIDPPVLHSGYEKVCAGSNGYVFIDPPADSSTSWQTVQWTVANGTISYQSTTSVSFTTDPSGQPASVTAVATDSLGCSNSASITIPVRTIAPPAIHLGQAAVCPGSSGYGYIDPPPGNGNFWSAVNWTITNGTINSQSTTSVSFITDPSGQAATLTAVVTDNYGCTATTSIPVPVRVLAPPAIHPYNAVVCAGAATGATVDPPGDQNGWTNIQWSIVNGTITSQSGRSVQFDTNPQGGSVTLTVAVVDAYGCQASSNVTIPTQTVAPPTLYLDNDASCPGAQNRVRLAPPANPSSSWSNTQWSITNGTANGTPGLDTFAFYTDASGQPATITVTAFDSLGCSASASITVPVHTIAPPAIQLTNPSSCPGAANHATLGSTSDPGTYWTSQTWSITNGTINGSPFWSSVDFSTDASGQPAVLSVTATDGQGCTATSSVTIPVRTITPPRITFDASASCAGASHGASVSYPNEPGHYWQYVQWSIVHGTITNGATWTNVQFTTDASGQPATLSVTVTDDAGCTTSASATLPVRTITAPRIVLDTQAVCPGSPSGAQIAYPDASSTYWTSVRWTITNGTITNGETWTNVQFTTDPGGQPATLTVFATDSLGCTTTASASVGVRTITPPRIVLDAPAVCAGAATSAQVMYPNEPGNYWSSVRWTITNGTITNGQTWSNVQFTTDPGGQPATLTVVATDGLGCTTSASATVGVRTIEPPPVYLDFDSVCPGGSNHARVPYPIDPSTYWVSGQWAITNGTLSNTNSTETDFTTDPGGQPASVYVTLLDNLGCRTVASATVGVSAGAPDIKLSTSAPSACAGGSVTVSSTDPRTLHGWSWSVVNGTITGPADGSSVTVTPNGAGPLRVTATALTEFGSCAATGGVTIPVLIPTINASGSTTFCAGGSVTLTAPSGGTYTWSNGATTQSIVVTSSGSYSVTISAAGGCSGTSAPVAVTVLPAPSATITPSGPTTFCGSGSVTLTAPSGYSYSWSTGATTQAITVSTGGTFTVTVTDSNGCSAASSVTTTVNAPTATIDVDVPLSCGAPGQLSLAPPSGGTWQSIQWTATNATITDGATSAVMHLQANGGNTATVTVSATDSFGCSATATTTLTPTVPITITSSVPKLCMGGGAQLKANLPSGDSFTSATWTLTNATSYFGLSGSTIWITPTGGGPITATVTGTDSAGCSGSATITIPDETGADTTITAPASGTFCQGSEFTASVPDAGPGATYSWGIAGGDFRSSGTDRTVTFYATSTDIQVNVSITANGCTANGSRTLTAMPTANVTVTAPAPVCYLSTNQTASVSDAGPGATYEWVLDNPDFQIRTTADPRVVSFDSIANPNFSGNGTIAVWVTNGNGCRQYYAAYMRIVVPAATISTSGPTTFCTGGHLTLTAGPTGAGYSYLWSNGATTPAIDVTQSGSYTVTVSWYGTCPKTSDAVVVNVSQPDATITPSGPTTFCAGGSVTLSAPAGQTYAWSNGATTQSIAVTSSGSYSVTVTNAQGCTATSSAVTVTANANPATPVITPGGPTTFCSGHAVGLTAPAGYAYQWSTGESTRTINVAASGSYTVTVIDPNGCRATSAPTVVTVNPTPATPTVTADGPTRFCSGGSVTLTAPAGYSYSWSNGATTQAVTVSATGSFTVTVTTADGCSATSAPTNVAVDATPPTPVVTASGPTLLCSGATVTLTAPGGYTYSWSNGATTQAITVSASGSYSVTVRAANGCTATSAPTAVTADTPQATVTASTTHLCGSGATATLTANSGASYLWSNGATTQAITVNAAGSYSVTVTDAAGCAATSAAVAVDAFDVTVTPPSLNICQAGGGGALTASAAVSYLWSNGATTQTIGVNTAGTYTVTATGANGCSVTSAPVVVTVRPSPSVTIAANTTTVCQFGQSVHVTGTVTGGSGTYTRYRLYDTTSGFQLVGDSTTALDFTVTPNHSPTTTYTALVDDANGCGSFWSNDLHLNFATPPAHSFSVSYGPYPGSGNCATSPVTISVQYPSEYASFLWSNGATTSSITVNTTGTYTVTGTTSAGCSYSSSVPLTFYPAPPKPVITASSTSICAGQSVTLTSTPAASYHWDNGATTQSITVTPSPGTGTFSYGLRITDANGCYADADRVSITVSQPPYYVAFATLDSACSTTSATVDANEQSSSRSTAGDTYLWSNGVTTKSFVTTVPGTFHVTVTSAQGCTMVSNDVNVVFNPPISVTATAQTPSTICAGGSVTIGAQVTGGTGPYTYRWFSDDPSLPSPFASGAPLTVSTMASHSYYVQVTDSKNCTATSAPVNVVVDTPPAPSVTVTGSLTFCPGGSVTLTAPAGYTYTWSNGATTQAIAATQPGVYYVTVANATGCTARSGNTTVSTYTPPSTPSVTAGGPTTFCAGGSVTLTAPSGYTYSWSTGATTQSITVSAAGSYTVTVADAHGCTATSAATAVTVNPLPPTPVITASGPTTFCPGGSVVLTAPAGYTYSWSTGATTQSITAIYAGSTTVTVTDANGCRATSAPVTTTVYSAPPSPAVTITPNGGMICDGQTATLTGPDGYSYQWSNGATTQSITSSVSGTFVLTVTDAHGCTASSNNYVTVFPVPATPTLTASGPTTFCQGGSVTLTAPTGYTNYLWSNGTTTWSNGSGQPQNQITVGSSGTYTVSVRNDNFCYSTSAPVVVTVNPPPAKPVITASGTTWFCQGGSVTLSAPAGYSYRWSNGATAQSIDVTASGSFTVTVTDANGCSTASDPTWVEVDPTPATPVITPSGPTTFCQGSSVQLSGPSGPNVWYHWSSGETWQTITVNSSGTYRLTVQNQYGCTSTSADVVVTVNPVPAKPTVTASGPTTFCSPGSVTLTASDLAPGNTYQWLSAGVPTGQTTQSITVTQGGYYAVRAVSPNGCGTASDLVTVTMYQTPSGSITASGPTTFCTPGSVTLTAPDGGTGAAYYWYPSGANTQSISVSSSGSYSVRVTSAYGCQFTTAAVAVSAVALPSPTVTASGSTAICAGQSVTLTAPGGYTYLWSPGNQTTQAISVSSAGSYHVTVTDANGCSGTSADTAVTVHPAVAPVITPGPTVAVCAGAYRILGFSHTSPDYASWTWSTGETTRTINVSAAGSYTVTAVDSYGCAWTSDPVVVTVNPSPTATVSANHTAICAGGNVTLTGSVTGGTAPFSYAWVRGNGTTVSGATSTTLTVSTPDNYSFFVTDANGCTSQSSFINVTNSTLTKPTVTASGSTTFCANGSVTLSAPAGYTYSWTGVTSSAQSINVTATGSYTVTVTDANGCSATSDPVPVTVNPLPSATITPSGSTTFCTGGSVTLSAPSGTGYTYSWSPGNATSRTINVSSSGTYTVTVTDTATGCTASSQQSVTVNTNPATPTITAGGPTTFCNGGSVTLTAPAGYSYSWSTGATTQSIVAAAQGSYTVTVTDAHGCSATSAATAVTVNPTITAYGPLTQTVAKNGTPQTLSVTATGPTLKYQWYKGPSGNTSTKVNSTTNTFKPPTNATGTFTYWVRVTSGTCTADSPVATVTVN